MPCQRGGELFTGAGGWAAFFAADDAVLLMNEGSDAESVAGFLTAVSAFRLFSADGGLGFPAAEDWGLARAFDTAADEDSIAFEKGEERDGGTRSWWQASYPRFEFPPPPPPRYSMRATRSVSPYA